MSQEEFDSRMNAGEDPMSIVADDHARFPRPKLLGYTVVEYNQASGIPSVVGNDIMDVGEAGEYAAACRAAIARTRRGERYAVAEVRAVEDPS